MVYGIASLMTPPYTRQEINRYFRSALREANLQSPTRTDSNATDISEAFKVALGQSTGRESDGEAQFSPETTGEETCMGTTPAIRGPAATRGRAKRYNVGTEDEADAQMQHSQAQPELYH